MAGKFDIVIVGGGINGVGIARDAAGRGLSVCLLEQNDLASGTSSASTKLIHGGLRYLEYYKFRLVRESLMEREVLWRIAPHIVWPLRFVLPYHKGMRPAWLLRLGLFIYDHLGGRKLLPATKTIDLSRSEFGASLVKGLYTKGYEYSDAWVNDARLVVLNAQDAAKRGADIRTCTKLVVAKRNLSDWQLTIKNLITGLTEEISTSVLVNAAGPWVAEVLSQVCGQNSQAQIRMVQGSHIIVRKMFDHNQCYIFQNQDNRIIFAIPYENDFTLIGTTDQDYQGNPAEVKASADEIKYLCDAANEYFAAKLSPKDVVATYSGVRPLYDDGSTSAQQATRDYVLDMLETDGAPLLSVFGGKITTYRRLALHVLEKLEPHLPIKNGEAVGWTGLHALPGGNFPVQGFEPEVKKISQNHTWLDHKLARRLVRSYGTNANVILHSAKSFADLGEDFGAGLTEAEVRYLMRNEWAINAADVLKRRSKLYLYFSPEQTQSLDNFMASCNN